MPVKPPSSLESLMNKKSTTKTFKLNEVTIKHASEVSHQNTEELLFKTYSRILNSEEIASKSKEVALIRKKVIVETTSLPNYDNRKYRYHISSLKKRYNFLFELIFQ